MSNKKFVLNAVEVKARGIFDKVREAVGEKVDVFKSFSEEPEFLGCDNPKMPLASDGTKGCFMFNGTGPAKEFAEALSKKLGVTADVDNFIGYGVVYVPADKYEEAIQKGIHMSLLQYNCGCWLDFYNERSPVEYAQIMALSPHNSCYDKDGNLKQMEEIIIKTWIKSLEGHTGCKIFFDKYSRKTIGLDIKRTTDVQTHNAVLDKIRASGLLTSSPFDGYAYVDYYGKYIR